MSTLINDPLAIATDGFFVLGTVGDGLVVERPPTGADLVSTVKTASRISSVHEAGAYPPTRQAIKVEPVRSANKTQTNKSVSKESPL